LLRSLRIENLVLIRDAELSFEAGLNVITGETGAGKTILAQAIGLLLGGKGDAGDVGVGGAEAYVEAEFELPAGLLDEELFETLRELRPEGEDGVVLARRISAEGRTRAYAWGRSAAREDVASLGERLLAMSGQFEQRRLARPSYQLAVLDAFCGEVQLRRRVEARVAWRELTSARNRYLELTRDVAAAEARLRELQALVDDTDGLEPGQEEALREERERLRHLTELVEGTAALDPEEGEGAAGLTAAAERALAPIERLAPELQKAADDLRDAELRLREAASALRSFLTVLEADPGRLEQVEAELDRIADTRRRFRCETFDDLLAAAAEAKSELDALEQGHDPVASAEETLREAERRVEELAADLGAARAAATEPFAEAVAAELRGMGMGDGEFQVELREREPSSTGSDEAVFLIRPNAGLPFASVAETASGGELSRVALAIAAVGGGETMVFDEIDAGIGGTTAHGVAETLSRLAARAQVVTITHLPQIASRADRHFRVEKVPGDPTHTRIQELGTEERKEEIERMLGGREFLATLET
jgi:DNA repair protein RecN (Recombination protein N)